MITLHNVSKRYGKSQDFAVKNLSLEIKDGEIFGFLGPNGAGKSTTIKMITGILLPTQGTIEVNGISLQQRPTEAKNLIGFVPDNHELYDTLKGIEYLNFIGAMYGVDSATLKSRVEEYASAFAIKDALPNLISTYSHGNEAEALRRSRAYTQSQGVDIGRAAYGAGSAVGIRAQTAYAQARRPRQHGVFQLPRH